MDMNVSNKRVLIFASSKGLGKATAQAYSEAGANVMISSRSLANCKETAQELEGKSKGKIIYEPGDVSNAEDIKRIVKKTADQLGGIDILVTNAGGPPPGNFEDLTEEDWELAYQMNLLSVMRAIKESLPYLKYSKGKIIMITSSSIKEPVDGLLLSNVFRMGLLGLMKTLSKELAQHQILINTVGPGRIDTERVRELDQKKADAENKKVEEVEEMMQQLIPLGRYGTPEEFANIILFLGSDRNTFITGQAFVVDGGMTRSY